VTYAQIPRSLFVGGSNSNTGVFGVNVSLSWSPSERR
jgi:hypothetical protein